MSAGRGHQPSLHDPKATTEAWAARHRPSDDKFNPHPAFGFHLIFAGALAIALAIFIAYAFARALAIGIIIAWAAAWILLDVDPPTNNNFREIGRGRVSGSKMFKFGM
jgi:hypothetical protein